MRKFIASVCVVALTAFGSVHAAKAASVDVDVDITLPSFLILYCFDDIHVSVREADLAAALGVTGSQSVQIAAPTTTTSGSTGTTITANMDIASEAGVAAPTLNAIDLELQNTCGFRAIGSGGTAAVSIGSVAGTLTAATPANGSIAVNSVTPSVTSVTLAGGLGTLNTFDATMSLDITNVVNADRFTSAGAEFTVTVTTP